MKIPRMTDRLIADTAKELSQAYKAALDEIRKELAKIFEKYSVDGKLTYAEMTKYNRLASMEKDIADILKQANQEAIKKIKRLPGAVYEESFYRAGWAFDQTVGAGLKWGLLNPKVVEGAVSNPMMDIATGDFSVKAIGEMRRIIAQDIIQGKSYPQMARDIARQSGRTYKNALRIVHTEGGRAQTLGTQAAFDRADSLGVHAKQIWVASLDDRTRDSHGALDGVERQEKGWYSPEVGWVEGPRLSGDPSFDINCRCDIRGEIEGLEPTVRRTREAGVVPYTTYNDWKANMEKNGGRYVPEKKIPLTEERDNLKRNEGE